MQLPIPAYGQFLETIPEAVIVVDRGGEIALANSQAEAMFGFKPGELLTRPLVALFPDNVQEVLAKHLEACFASSGEGSPNARLKLDGQRYDGGQFPLEVLMKPVPDDGDIFVLAFIRDISEYKRAELALRASEARYRTLFENSTDAIFVHQETPDGLPGNYIEVNDVACQSLGYTRDELLAMRPMDLTPREKFGQLSGMAEKIHAENYLLMEWVHLAKDGSHIQVELNVRRFMMDGVPTVVAVARDIGERKRAEEILQENEARWRSLVENAPAVIMLLDKDGLILSTNLTVSGRGVEQVIGTSVYEYLAPEERERVREAVEVVFSTGASQQYEIHGYTPSGSDFWFETRLSPVQPAGETRAAILFSLDITRRKLEEAARRESEIKYQALIEQASDAIFVTSREGHILEVNNRACEMLGYAREELLQLSIEDLMASDELARQPVHYPALRAGQSVVIDRRLRRKDGSLIPVETSARMVLDNLIQAIVRDVTVRKQAEAALRQSEQTARALLNAFPDAALMLDAHGVVLAANDAVQRRYAHADTIIGKSMQELDPPGLFESRSKKLAEVLRTRQPLTFIDQRDGLHLENRLQPILNDQGNVTRLAVFSLDITERKRAEQALRESEERLQASVRVANIGIFDHDHQTGTIFWSPRQREIHGWGADEPVSLQTFSSLVHPDDKDRIMESIRQAHDPQGNGIWDVEHRIIRRDGSLRWLSAKSQTFFEGEAAARHPVRTVGAVLDVTERKQTEEMINQSLAEKEILLKEIHHRVKNNLQVISSLLYLQSRRFDDRDMQNLLRESQNRVASMALIHEKLYQSTNLAQIDFIEYARDLTEHLCLSYGVDRSRITLTLQAHDLALDINVAVPCGLIINEIISNSLKYAFPGGRRGAIRIELSLDANNWRHLILSDDGVGLPPDIEERGRSTLGLTLIERLVDQLDGFVERSNSDPGIQYHIQFPNTPVLP